MFNWSVFIVNPVHFLKVSADMDNSYKQVILSMPNIFRIRNDLCETAFPTMQK